MPVVSESGYKPAFWFKFRHINTIFPAFFRSFPGFEYQRERITIPDGDFLDLDWSRNGNDKLLIVLHGLEGSTQRPYVKGMIRLFNQMGWDGLGVNHRTCSGELNRLLRSYHMGVSDDLASVLDFVIKNHEYSSIVLAGFSLGGNVLLKFLGEEGSSVPDEVKAAVAISVPIHIESASVEIDKWFNRHYVWRFMRTLNRKMEEKARRFPGKLDVSRPMPGNFAEFDDRFTSHLHGFKNARDYWRKCSSHQFLKDINVPTLLINARDDSFLSEKCFPYEIAKENAYFYLETPRWGGHVGFAGDKSSNGAYWTESRAYEFVTRFL